MHTAPMTTNKTTGEEMAALQAVAEDKKVWEEGIKEKERERERIENQARKKSNGSTSFCFFNINTVTLMVFIVGIIISFRIAL